MSTYAPPPSNPLNGLRATALLVALGLIALLGTWALTKSSEAEAVSLEPALEEVQAETVEVSGNLVLAGHPNLPIRFHETSDAILASPMVFHPDFANAVERWTERWADNFSESVPTYLSRMAAFDEVVDSTLRAAELPASLRYLPVIESGYSPTAVSSASAVGLWQFMEPTARELGVEVDDYIDDRRDPYVATRAAAEYLTELHGTFNSWFLALAAYNAGPDRIQGLLDRYLPGVEPSDAAYWALQPVLPEETANFVPNFFGAVIVASAPTEFGYATPTPMTFEYDSVRVQGSILLSTVAEAAGVSQDAVVWLNPELVQGRTPRDREVLLRLPLGSAPSFRSYFAATDR